MTIRFRHALLLPLVLLLTLIPAVSPAPVRAQEPERLRVVATFSILGDIVRNVASETVDLTVIVGPDGDAHTFEPNPDQISALADADLIVENGAGFEPWLDDVYESSGSTATRVAVTDGLPLLAFGSGEHDEHEDEHDEGHEDQDYAAEDGHDHGDHDPHAWHDVANVIIEVGTIRDALSAADPANAATYAANSDLYIAQLETLDADIRALVGTIPAEGRVLFTSHDSLAYFAHAYGFSIAGSAIGSVSTEAADPAAGEIAELIDEIRAASVPAIFAENVENSDLMEQIARDAGVELAPTLYTDALSEDDGPAATYIALMTYNAAIIVTALGGSVD